MRETVELCAVVEEEMGDLVVRALDNAAHFLVDEQLGLRRGFTGAGGNHAPGPSLGRSVTGPSRSLMPQRPTIWRVICVSCWMCP